MLLVDVGAFSSLFSVFLRVETGELVFPALPVWCVCLLSCYGLLCLLLRRPRTARLLILTCLGFFLVQVALAFALYGLFAGATGLIFTLGMWMVAYYHAYSLALKPPGPEKIMTFFEICVLVLLFSLLYCSVQRIAFVCALPSAVAAVLALVGLIARRTASGRGKTGASRGAGTVFGVLGAFALGALLLAGAAAGAVKTLATAVWKAFTGAMAFLGRCVTALLDWLVSLVPEGEAETLPPEAIPGNVPGEMPPTEQLVDHSLILYGLLALVALAILVVLIWRILRGGELQRRLSIGGGRVTRRRTGMGKALSRWLHRLRGQLLFHLHRVLRRNTAPGLFVWLERRNAIHRKGRRAGESCREYLLRLAPDYPEAEAALRTLAEDLDEYYFGHGSRLTKREIRALRKKLSRRGENP